MSTTLALPTPSGTADLNSPSLTIGSFGITSTSTGDPTRGSTFVGSTPSAVLFFLAMAVGVAIACLFIFFTIRYFVRSRYGFHMYTVSSRGVLFSSGVSTEVNYYHYSNREIREHLQYLRNHHYIRDEFLERRLFSAVGRRRRRRGRFSKMKKLTPLEVEELFPKNSYANWLASGTDEEGEAQLAELASSVDPKSTVENAEIGDVVELHQLDVTHSNGEDDDPDHVIAYIGDNGAKSNREMSSRDLQSDGVSLTGELHKMHFDLGSCAICLETFESDDVVRGLFCGHVYHSDCLDPWLTRRRACCPICKRDYYKEDNANSNGIRPSNIVEGSSMHDNQSTAASNVDSEAAETLGDGTDAETATANANTTETEAGRAVDAEANTANNRRETTPPANEGTLDIFNDEINHEYLRRDSHIQALFNELIPLSERVRVILEEHPDMGLEARAREVAARKYRNIWRVIFWRLMGISKEDLYQWAVLDLYQASQRTSNRGEENTGDTTNEATENGSEHLNGSSNGNRGTNLETGGESVPVEMTERPHIFHRSQTNLSSPYGNARAEHSEIDVSEAARREAAERNA